MTLITPAGKMNFDWSPKGNDLTKTASTGTQPKTDKDILFEAAQKFVKAQMALEIEDTNVDAPPSDSMPDSTCEKPCDKMPPTDGIAGAVEGVAEIASEGKSDAVQAVQELADKAQKAEEVAGKVQEAVTKVEEAVQEVKDAVGAAVSDDAGAPSGDKVPDEVVMDVEVEDEGEEKEEEKGEEKEEKEEKEEGEEGEKDEMVKESIEACAAKKVEMKTASEKDDLVKTSKISPTTRKKITTFWKDYLGYDPAYVKLMGTDFEK